MTKTNQIPTAVIGQIHIVKNIQNPMIDARACRLAFHYNPHLKHLEPTEYRVPKNDIRYYPLRIDGLPVVVDPTGTVLPGHIYLCTTIPADQPEPTINP